MDKKELYLFSLEIKQLISKKHLDEAEKLLSQAKLVKEELVFVEECLNSYSYDHLTDSFSIAHGDNSEFLKLVAIVMTTVKNKK